MTKTELGPQSWNDFVGQDRLKRRLQIHIQAAFSDQRPLEHVFLSGPPGFGKTTLANLIAGKLTDPLETLVMPMTRKTLINALIDFQGGVLFLDEIHAMSRKDQEILLPVLDRGVVTTDRGAEYSLGWLTLVAATTERDKIIAPLYDRFAIKPDFAPYTDEELGQIVKLMAEQVKVELNEEEAVALGCAAGGVPRIARQFVFAARDLATISGSPATVEEILDLCETEPDGLTAMHRRYLDILRDQKGQAGMKTIESLLQVPSPALYDIERLLLHRRYVEYASTGRQLTPEGRLRIAGHEVRQYSRR